MIPINSKNAQILLSRVDTDILLKSDLEYVRYFIKLMEGFFKFQPQRGYPFSILTSPSKPISREQFIYFLQIEIYEILEKLNQYLPKGQGTLDDDRASGFWCEHHGFICKCDQMRRPTPCPWKLKPGYGGGTTLIPTVYGLEGEFRYKFNKIDDIHKFISAIELYLLNQPPP